MIWRPGDTAVQRFVRTDGSIGQHHPMRVLSDDGETLIGWMPAGTDIVNTRLADGRDPREVPLAEMFVLPRVRLPGKWLDTHTVRLVTESDWSSVWWFFELDGTFRNWYVNLELPRGRTSFPPIGWMARWTSWSSRTGRGAGRTRTRRTPPWPPAGSPRPTW